MNKNLLALFLVLVTFCEQNFAAGISVSPVTSGEWVLEKRVAVPGDVYLANVPPVFSADGKSVAIVEKRSITVYESDPADPTFGAIKFQIPLDAPASLTGAFVKFNLDSSLLCASESFVVSVWDVRAGKRLFSHIENSRSANYQDIRPCAFLPDGKHLSIASWSANSILMDINTGKIVHELPSTIGATADGTKIAVSEDETRTDIIDVISGHILLSIPGNASVSWTGGDRFIAAKETSGSTKIYEASNGKLFFKLPEHFYQVAMDFAGTRFAGITGKNFESVELYDIKTKTKLWSVGDKSTTSRRDLNFSQDGTQLLSSFYAPHGHNLMVLSGESAPAISVIVGRANYKIHDYSFSEDGSQISVFVTSQPAGVVSSVRELLYFKKLVK